MKMSQIDMGKKNIKEVFFYLGTPRFFNNTQRFSEENATIIDEWSRKKKNYEALVVAALAFRTISGVPAFSFMSGEIFPIGIDQVAGKSAL
jgi:hypothetical protein